IIAVKNVPSYRGAYTDAQYEQIKQLADICDNFRLGRTMDILASVENLIRYSSQPQIILDACLIKAAELQTEPNIEALLSRIRALEARLKKIETTGIKLEAQSSFSQNTNPVAPAKSVEDTLAKVASEVEEIPVFEEPAEDAPPEPDSLAKSVMSALLTAVREQGYNMLYTLLAQQEDFLMKDNILNIKISDAASWSLLSANSNPELLKTLVKEAFGGDYGVELIRKSNKTEIRHESRNTLTELFGNRLQDKNRR
ncbi:MAG: hypothetical protein PHI19_03175, partial [Clostridia bacterium]|nr:hypothetical protein [Clostridia bacterium]